MSSTTSTARSAIAESQGRATRAGARAPAALALALTLTLALTLGLGLASATAPADAHGGVCADDEWPDWTFKRDRDYPTIKAAVDAANAPAATPATKADFWCKSAATTIGAFAADVIDCFTQPPTADYNSGAPQFLSNCTSWGYEANVRANNCSVAYGVNVTCCDLLLTKAPTKGSTGFSCSLSKAAAAPTTKSAAHEMVASVASLATVALAVVMA